MWCASRGTNLLTLWSPCYEGGVWLKVPNCLSSDQLSSTSVCVSPEQIHKILKKKKKSSLSFCHSVWGSLVSSPIKWVGGGGHPKFLPAPSSLLGDTQLVKIYLRSQKLAWFIFSNFAFTVPKVVCRWEIYELAQHWVVVFFPLSNVPGFVAPSCPGRRKNNHFIFNDFIMNITCWVHTVTGCMTDFRHDVSSAKEETIPVLCGLAAVDTHMPHGRDQNLLQSSDLPPPPGLGGERETWRHSRTWFKG